LIPALRRPRRVAVAGWASGRARAAGAPGRGRTPRPRLARAGLRSRPDGAALTRLPTPSPILPNPTCFSSRLHRLPASQPPPPPPEGGGPGPGPGPSPCLRRRCRHQPDKGAADPGGGADPAPDGGALGGVGGPDPGPSPCPRRPWRSSRLSGERCGDDTGDQRRRPAHPSSSAWRCCPPRRLPPPSSLCSCCCHCWSSARSLPPWSPPWPERGAGAAGRGRPSLLLPLVVRAGGSQHLLAAH